VINSIQDKTVLNNGVEMPWFGLGVFRAQDGAEVAHSVQWALEAGYRSIDTAAIYDNEEGVGQGIHASDVSREDVFLTTKVWNADHGYDSTRRAFDDSLKRLGGDYVDLYLIHWPVKGKFKDTWRALERIYQDGQARAIGVSNFLMHQLQDLMADAEVMPMVNQVEFHPYLRQPALLEFCKANRIQLEAWSPLMKGEVFKIPEFSRIAERYGKTSAQLVLRWDLQHGVVTIPKSVKLERIIANADVFDFEISAEDMAVLDAMDRAHRLGPDPDNFDF
jgi:diketogulonate reductase-like aldo/keto reductase